MIPHIEPLPGANQLLWHLSRRGIRFAIASTGGREQTSPRLTRPALPAGTPIVTADDAEKAKPSPDILRDPGRSSQSGNSQPHRGRRQRVGPARRRSEERLRRRILVGRLGAGRPGQLAHFVSIPMPLTCSCPSNNSAWNITALHAAQRCHKATVSPTGNGLRDYRNPSMPSNPAGAIR